MFNNTPIGTIVAFAGLSLPVGWLPCDGREISRNDYPELSDVLGQQNLPDLRGEFIRGLDNGRGIDNNRRINTLQESCNKSLVKEGTYENSVPESTMPKDQILFKQIKTVVQPETHPPFENNTGTLYIKTNDLSINGDSHSLLGVQSLLIDTCLKNNEARPRNIAMNYIIKAKHLEEGKTIEASVVNLLNDKIENNRNNDVEIRERLSDILGMTISGYIQDNITKEVGRLYLDKNQQGIFKCVNETSSTVNSYLNFSNITLKENDDLHEVKLLNIQGDSPRTIEELNNFGQQIITNAVVHDDRRYATKMYRIQFTTGGSIFVRSHNMSSMFLFEVFGYGPLMAVATWYQGLNYNIFKEINITK